MFYHGLYLLLATLWMISCGSSQSPTVSQPTPEKSYQFINDSCDTGNHVFSGLDEHAVLLEYCRTLLNDDINNACALEERSLKFDEDCSSVRGELVNDTPENPPPTDNTEKNKPKKTFYGILAPDETLNYFDIKQSTHDIQVSVTYLEMLKLDDYTFRADETIQTNIGNVFIALKECGFYLAGPHCREGQISEKLWDQLVVINDKTYYYLAAEYSDYFIPVAYFFELDTTLNYAPTGNLYIYTISNKAKAHSPADIIQENSGAAVGKAQFAPMTLETRWQTVQISEASQEILAASNWLIDQEKFIKESVFLDLSEKLLKVLKGKKNFISDARSGRSIYYYLLTLQRLMPESEFKIYLTELTHGISKDLFTLQSAIMLISLGNNPEENLTLAKLALLTKDKDTFLRALDILVKENVSLDDFEKNQLINALVHKDSTIALRSYDALKFFGVDKTHLSTLDEKLKGRLPEHSPPFILSLIASIKDKKALELLISYMSHAEANTRLAAYSIVENTEFDNEALPYFKKQFSSTYPETRIAVARALAKVNSFESMKMIIDNVSDDLDLNRITLLQIIGSYSYSDGYITTLQNQFKSPYLDVRVMVFELIYKIGTKNAYQAVIRNLSDPDEKFRGQMIAVIEKLPLSVDFVPALISGFNSKYTDVKEAVTRFLISIPAKEATSAIIRNLSQSDPAIRASLIAELQRRKIDDSFLADLKSQFYSYYPEIKEMVFDLIIGMDTDESKIMLIENISNSTQSIRQSIIAYLDTIEMKDAYLSNMKWSFTSAYYLDVRQALVRYIAKLSSTDATVILINIMDAYESLVRSDIQNILESRTMTSACLNPLKLQLSDYYDDVRISVAGLLAKIPTQESLSALKGQLRYERVNTVKEALNAAISKLEKILG